MFILTTLDDFFPAIWERDGIAKYDSYFERQGVVARMKATLGDMPYAVGIYRKNKKMPQCYPPSLLKISSISQLERHGRYTQDIFIKFSFVKKLSVETNNLLSSMKNSVSPLIFSSQEERLYRTIIEHLAHS